MICTYIVGCVPIQNSLSLPKADKSSRKVDRFERFSNSNFLSESGSLTKLVKREIFVKIFFCISIRKKGVALA